jgi:1-acyl-sn-glycerol-3-phosphate acyltransferase
VSRAEYIARRRRPSATIIARSVVFNVLFYLNLVLLLFAAMATLPMPRPALIAVARLWARTSLWMLRVICKTGVAWKGLEKIPAGAVIVGAKHQSFWETFALVTVFRDPTFIVKRELMWIPMFGWCLWRGGMIPVDRRAGKQALAVMNARARAELDDGRQIIIAHVYAEGAAPCLPVALNSGLFWPRRRFLRYPGTIQIEFLDPIPPGLDRDVFFSRMQQDIESATTRLLADGERDLLAIQV